MNFGPVAVSKFLERAVFLGVCAILYVVCFHT